MLARAVLIATLALLMGPRDALCALACSGAEAPAPIASAQDDSAQHAATRESGAHAPCADRGTDNSDSRPGEADDCAADLPVLVPGAVDAAAAALATPLPLSPVAMHAATARLAISRPPAPLAPRIPPFLENASLLL